ncbi:hypothetical protein B0H14DRAFT_2568774 [Mycena olivaceomarginata]|nr:hypothetical protein B0H14DRAFT_2568774 [Mycena olivaceomarginata]
MAGGGVAETVKDAGEADQEGGKPVAARATENRRKMCCEDGNGREMKAAHPREGGAKEVGGGEQRRAKLRLGYSERVMVPFELCGVHRRPKAGGRSGCGVECRESSRQALGSLWLGGGSTAGGTNSRSWVTSVDVWYWVTTLAKLVTPPLGSRQASQRSADRPSVLPSLSLSSP